MINKLILGTVQFGLKYGINNPHGRPSESEVFAILANAWNNGIEWLDTAAAYGDSEERIGAFLKQSSIANFKIISKFHVTNNSSPQESLQRSLSKLHVSHIDTYLYHSFKDFWEHPESLPQLEALREESLIRAIGVSVYNNNELKAAFNTPAIDVIQLPFNLLDNDSQRGDLLRTAQQKGKVIHTRSAFLQGLFFKKPDTLSEQFASLQPYLKQLEGIRNDVGLSRAEMYLGYVCSKPYINGVLIGVDSREQLKENIVALKNPLPEAVIQKIDEIRVKEIEILNPVNWKK